MCCISWERGGDEDNDLVMKDLYDEEKSRRLKWLDIPKDREQGGRLFIQTCRHIRIRLILNMKV